MPELILARHAECESYSARSDLDRKLVPEGERQAESLGKHMREHNLVPNLAVSSPAVRAKRTVEIALAQLDTEVPVEIEQRIAPGSSLQNHIKVLREQGAERLMFTGHNPGFSYLASWLAHGSEGLSVRVGRGDLRLFELEGSWDELIPAAVSLELERPARELVEQY